MASCLNGSFRKVTVWVHGDNFSKDEVLIAPDIFGAEALPPHALVEIMLLKPSSEPHGPRDSSQVDSEDFGDNAVHSTSKVSRGYSEHEGHQEHRSTFLRINGDDATFAVDTRSRYLFIAKPMPSDIRLKQPTLQVSITCSIASRFGYRQRAQAAISLADPLACSASHVELVFRDEYLSRSDMWRLVRSELAGKTVYKGQKIQFLATIKAVIRSIYIRGRTVSSAYFCGTTVPVFRSESARYVLFIQMSREMWDFDSEGTGEIMFSRVIDGFLPELFKKWVELEARHLVSIVLFGRLEYDRHALAALQQLNSDNAEGSSIAIDENVSSRDFYRVVVTDMASGQWTTILNELKKDFLVFLRDITLHQPRQPSPTEGLTESEIEKDSRSMICGRPTSALRGNILEAINIASSQFASDYIDRDLVRTGISVVLITPGPGVFEVDRQLLALTSENLTNNGIGIDLVCLSRMPLHSVPLFKWRTRRPETVAAASDTSLPLGNSPRHFLAENNTTRRPRDPSPSPSLSPTSFLHPRARGKAISMQIEEQWSFGIPQWIDVSYWASGGQQRRGIGHKRGRENAKISVKPGHSHTFRPRVRMYELQMMGLMELGLANISIPYLSEGSSIDGHSYNSRDTMLEHRKSTTTQFGYPSTSPRPIKSLRTNNSAYTANVGRGLLSVQAKQQGDMYERMDSYDRNLFKPTPSTRSTNSRLKSRKTNNGDATTGQDSNRQSSRSPRRNSGRFDASDTDTIRTTKVTKIMRPPASSSNSKSDQENVNPIDSRISRSISFALRGLGPSAPRAVASTKINAENAQAGHTIPKYPPQVNLRDSSRSLRSPANTTTNRISVLSFDSQGSEPSDASHYVQASKTSPSRPISITNTVNRYQIPDQRSNDESAASISEPKVLVKEGHSQDSKLLIENTRAISGGDEMSEAESIGDVISSTLTSDISPWIKTVNPANPSKNHPNADQWVGRWQHVFPRAPRTSAVKWKSLCTPASVPLTTEALPSKEDLDQHYIETNYTVSLHDEDDDEMAEGPDSREMLLREMIGLRLSHGYQLVTGKGMTNTNGADAAASARYFTTKSLAHDDAQVFMSMGNTIQKLVCVPSDEVRVTRYVRRTSAAAQEKTQSMSYSPVIRTILAKSYSLRAMTLAGFSEEYPWNLADSHMAGQKHDLTNIYEQLRFWRARFVVIPIEPPEFAKKASQSMSEDNEEEIHLLGIRELTKMWQKTRYSPPEKSRFKPTPGKRKDPNPLEIIFQTLNPSEVVATEIEKLLIMDEGADSRQIQLLPDSELLERSTSSLSKIAQVLQGEKGVEITNRRWHLKLHYSCFKGDDFTNWLLSIFKDIHGREEAVEFGNELMRHGLFHHVSTRHNFKDGNYFYTIAPEHRVSRPESRSSWFPGGRRSDRSVPATPLADSSCHMSPLSGQSQSGWNPARHADTRPSDKSGGEKKLLSVSLTKMMRLDVDHRNPKRSDRPEIVNLHYDRLHNPENCYHLELSWLNVTSKLIEDAIVNWATQSEKYGLRLVEVPIAEACNITDREPFRAPYRIVLKVQPPPPGNMMVGNGNMYFTNSSFALQTTPSSDKLIYQKALLKRFNFVLDLEAASDFPPDVDVSYTWGRLGYRYPQFVHRSGVILAQITDDGELLLLANRLYNTRSASTKDAAGKFEGKNNSHHRPIPASAIVGLNAPNPSPHPSPLVRASSDVLGSRDALSASGMAAYTTPEQIKDELEAFCHDSEKLTAFYKEFSERGPPLTRKSGSSSSSVLRPVPEYGLENSIPDLRLPASVVTTATAAAKGFAIAFNKKTSPQPARRASIAPETINTDISRRTSADSH
jgi:DEP domain-containing protein 5